MNRKKSIRLIAIIAAAVLLVSFVAPVFSMMVFAEDDFAAEQAQIDNLSGKYKDLQAQQNKIQQQINSAKTEKDKQVAIKQQIGAQIDTTTEQITVLTERIALLKTMISEKQDELNDKMTEINNNYELFKCRLVAMTRVPQGNAIGMVLGADTYSQFVNRTEIMTRIAQYDRELIAELNRQKQTIERVKAEIEKNKQEVESDQAALEEKKTELDGRMKETQKQIHDIGLMEQQFLANKAALQKQMAQVQAEIDAIYEEIARRSTQQVYVGGSLSQPTPTLNQVTSHYGWRFNGSDFHTGIDFSGGNAYGAAVVAANTGVVAKVNHAVTPGYGYGKYIIIDHGGGITTLYAHLSAINVQEGDTVGRGKKIGAVGSTGWSTGPHLHFEVRVNGKHQNPVGYLTGK